MLKYWLKAVVVPYNKSVTLKDLISICENKLSVLQKKSVKLELADTHWPKEKRILKKRQQTPQLELSALETPEEEFSPKIDIIQGT